MAIKDLLKGKTLKEKANIKSQAIVNAALAGTYFEGDIKIEIKSIAKIEGGVEVFARAWKNGNQLGFGVDGTVDIERFKIFNPPIMVPDGTKKQVGTLFGAGTGEEDNFKEDPQEAILQVLAHTAKVAGKENTTIEQGKVGNTTATFYPDAGSPGTTSMDGQIRNSGATYSTVHDAATGAGIDTVGTGALLITNSVVAGTYYIDRSIVNFDTSSLGASAVVSKATFSIMQNTANYSNADSDSVSVILNTVSSNTAYATSDFGSFGTTKQATDVTFASLSNGVYADMNVNSTGISNISKTGITKFGIRTAKDISNTTPSGNTIAQFYAADTTGTTSDPKLVVVYTTALTDGALLYYKFDDSTSTDATGNGYNGTDTSITYSSGNGKISNGAGATNGLITNTSADLKLSTIGLSFWIKSSGGTFGAGYRAAIICNERYSIYNLDNALGSYDWGAATFRSTGMDISDDAWHHVVLNYDSGVTNGSEIWVDNVLKLTTTITNGGAAGNFKIFSDGVGSQNMSGAIDEVYLRSIKFAPSEISSLYNSGSGLQWSFVTDLTISVSDSITITESVIIEMLSNVSVNDALTISESVMMHVENNVSIDDSLTVTESVTMHVENNVSVSDDLTITESAAFEVVSDISVSDALSITESVTNDGQLGDISVSDPLSISESVNIEQVLELSVSDAITLSESVQVDVPFLGDISVVDSLTITESITMFRLQENIGIAAMRGQDDSYPYGMDRT